MFPWYAPLYILPAALSVIWLVGVAPRIVTAAAAILLLAPTVLLAERIVVGAYDNTRVPNPLYPAARVQQLLAVSSALESVCPDCVLLAPEIGAPGYAFDGHIVDAVGLVSPAALGYHPMQVPDERANRLLGSIPVGLVEETDPDFVVSLSGFATSLLSSKAAKGYQTLTCPPGAIEGEPISYVFGMSELLIMIDGDRDHLIPAIRDATESIGCTQRNG